MKGAWDQNVIFRFFSEHHKNFFTCQISRWSDTRFRFFPTDIPFLANMWREYFSFNIWTVVYQSELELSDQNWAKIRPLLFKTLESWNATLCSEYWVILSEYGYKRSCQSKQTQIFQSRCNIYLNQNWIYCGWRKNPRIPVFTKIRIFLYNFIVW